MTARPLDTPPSYRADIDGLRTIAVGSVVLFHAGVPVFQGGFVGVDIFFVISGLLIGSHVYSDIQRGKFRIADFYRKRAKRILPALLIVLTFCYLVAFFLMSARELKAFGAYAITTVLSGSNIYAWLSSNYFAPSADQNPLLMTWSLGVEEQFYLFFPILMVVFARAHRKQIFIWTVGIAAFSLMLCVVGTLKRPTLAFYLLPTRGWELAIGFLLALYENGRDSRTLYNAQRYANLCSILGLAAVGASVLFYSSRTSFPGFAALLPTSGAALLISSRESFINRSILSSKPFVAIGQVSYSLYLWHWPILSFLHIASDHPLSAWMGCTAVGLSLVFATLSYWLVEQPFRRSTTPNRLLLVRYGLLGIAAIIPGILFVLSSGLPQRVPQIAITERVLNQDARTCWGITTPDLSPTCVDVRDPRPAIALIGDSHAEALAAGLAPMAAQTGYKFYKLVKSSCAPLSGVTPILYSLAAEKQCIEYNARVLSFLEHDVRVHIVIITGYWASPLIDGSGYVTGEMLHRTPSREVSTQNFRRGLEATISTLIAAGKQVILVSDVPTFRFDPVRRMLAHATPLRGYLVDRLFSTMDRGGSAPLTETFQPQDQEVERVLVEAAERLRVQTFDLKTNLCHSGDCEFYSEPDPLYFDEQHLTPAGAKRAVVGISIPHADQNAVQLGSVGQGPGADDKAR